MESAAEVMMFSFRLFLQTQKNKLKEQSNNEEKDKSGVKAKTSRTIYVVDHILP